MQGPQLNLKIEAENDAALVTVSGDVDAASLALFQRTLEPLCMRQHPRIYLDCQNLNYINSAGVGVLYAFTRLCQDRGGMLVICRPRKKILNVFEVLGLHKLLNISLESAEETAKLQRSASS